VNRPAPLHRKTSSSGGATRRQEGGWGTRLEKNVLLPESRLSGLKIVKKISSSFVRFDPNWATSALTTCKFMNPRSLFTQRPSSAFRLRKSLSQGVKTKTYLSVNSVHPHVLIAGGNGSSKIVTCHVFPPGPSDALDRLIFQKSLNYNQPHLCKPTGVSRCKDDIPPLEPA